MAVSLASIAMNAAFMTLPTMNAMRHARAEHRSAAGAFAASVFTNIIPQLAFSSFTGAMGFAMQIVLPLAFAAGGSAVMAGVRSWSGAVTNVRNITATPFSTSYEPSERAALSLRHGVSALAGARQILGAEASLFHARYAR